jgi:hypothetical protein
LLVDFFEKRMKLDIEEFEPLVYSQFIQFASAAQLISGEIE